MIEGDGRRRGSFETPRENLELLKTPEQIFDRSPEQARAESEQAIERLVRAGEVHREGRNAEFEIAEAGAHSAPAIQIFWPEKQGTPATLLRLTPISEGKGAERGIFGYRGSYGPAHKTEKGYEFADGEGKSLEETLSVPKGMKLVVKPTPLAWAVEKNSLDQSVFGENSRNLYMGLGLLFLGREYMFIGMHEAGHLPDNHDENLAWRNASIQYARVHGPRKEAVIQGTDTGEFDLLKRPTGERDITAGKIIRAGLSSYARNGRARIPERWRNDGALEKTIRDFQNILSRANDEYERMTRR